MSNLRRLGENPLEWRLRVIFLGIVVLVAVGCSGADSRGDVGAVCDVDEDCLDDLVCDLHDDGGSCQKPHEH